MDESEILRYLFKGVRPELKSSLYAAKIQSVDEFREFAKNLEKGIVYQSQSSEINELKQMIQNLIKENSVRPQYNRMNRPHFTNTVQTQPERTIDNQPVCYYCKRPGHYKANCRKLQFNLQNNVHTQHQSRPNPNFPRQTNYPYRQDNRVESRYPINPQFNNPKNYFNNDSRPHYVNPNQPNLPQTQPVSQNVNLPQTQSMPSDRPPTTQLQSNHLIEESELYVISDAWIDDVPVKCIIDSGSAVSIVIFD